jgi:hypothetical protein
MEREAKLAWASKLFWVQLVEQCITEVDMCAGVTHCVTEMRTYSLNSSKFIDMQQKVGDCIDRVMWLKSKFKDWTLKLQTWGTLRAREIASFVDCNLNPKKCYIKHQKVFQTSGERISLFLFVIVFTSLSVTRQSRPPRPLAHRMDHQDLPSLPWLPSAPRASGFQKSILINICTCWLSRLVDATYTRIHWLGRGHHILRRTMTSQVVTVKNSSKAFYSILQLTCKRIKTYQNSPELFQPPLDVSLCR